MAALSIISQYSVPSFLFVEKGLGIIFIANTMAVTRAIVIMFLN